MSESAQLSARSAGRSEVTSRGEKSWRRFRDRRHRPLGELSMRNLSVPRVAGRGRCQPAPQPHRGLLAQCRLCLQNGAPDLGVPLAVFFQHQQDGEGTELCDQKVEPPAHPATDDRQRDRDD